MDIVSRDTLFKILNMLDMRIVLFSSILQQTLRLLKKRLAHWGPF